LSMVSIDRLSRDTVPLKIMRLCNIVVDLFESTKIHWLIMRIHPFTEYLHTKNRKFLDAIQKNLKTLYQYIVST
jgi:hypothetical protein